jgi:hypothetical protein
VPCNGKRYLQLNLSKDSKHNTRPIHILVAEAFLGYDSKNGFGLVVDHIDNNPHNNKLSNLQIVTTRENTTKDCPMPHGLRGISWHKPLSKWRAQISM